DHDRDLDVAVVLALPEERLERGLQVVEVLVGQIEPRAQAADDEMRDVAEVLLRGDDERDLVRHERAPPASRSSSSSSCSRRAAASLPACTACFQLRRALKSDAP